LLRPRKELSSGSDVVFRRSRVGRRSKHDGRESDGRAGQATREAGGGYGSSSESDV
jgi:hypothetical protein